MSKTEFDNKLTQLALNIRQGCDLSTTYDPKYDIEKFIDNEKSDIIIFQNIEGVQVCSNNTNFLGDVIQYDRGNDIVEDEDPIVILQPIVITGNAESWVTYFETISNDSTTFLKDFMLQNTQ